MTPKPKEENGLWFPDTFLQYIRGYSPLYGAVADGLEGLRKEVDAISSSLFPYVKVPVVDRPGYVSNEQNYFHVRHSYAPTKEVLESYFLSRWRRYSEHLYGGHHDLPGLLESVVDDMFFYGKAYLKIEWGEVEIKGHKGILPVSFERLDVLTMRRSLFGGYVQKYSLYEYYFGYHFKRPRYGKEPFKRTYRFAEEDIVVFEYPFGPVTPIKKTYKFVPKLRGFWQFGLDQQRTTLEPKNHSFPLEYARHVTFKSEKRKYALLKARLKKAFHNAFGADLNTTSYYDIYVVTRYKKALNDLRDALIRTFNEQVMVRIAKKNGWEEVPEIYIDQFLTNLELDAAFEDFAKNKIDSEGYIDLVLRGAKK